jgi:hypothetical protein
VERWGSGASDEQRIGLTPLLRRVWAPMGPRPRAPVRQRFDWRYVVGFVQPAAGRSLFHLATRGSLPLCEGERAEFAPQAGAGPDQQLVLIRDRAGGQTSVRLRVPEQVHRLFWPPYSPELPPAEQLWPLTNTCLINRQCATIEELADVQFACCADLQRQRERIRSTTLFHGWPKRIKKRQGPTRR